MIGGILWRTWRARLRRKLRRDQTIRSAEKNETQNDRWVREIVFPGMRGGFFLEAGACDGYEASSCYPLERELGWTGICVEPNQAFFRRLVANRPRSTCVNVCLASEPGKVVFVEGTDATPLAFLSGIKENLERYKSNSEQILKEGREAVRDATTLEALLDAHGAPTTIDYASFDIEGSELDVLRVFPFSRYRFRAVTLECDQRIWDGITELFRGNGYWEIRCPFHTHAPWERYWLHESMR